jgi:hypothetical protein
MLWSVSSQIQANASTDTTKSKTLTQKRIEQLLGDEYIAEAISKSKRPYLYAAIKYEESRLAGPGITGDNGESIGMFQVQPKHHGAVPDGVEPQVAQCERILEPLIKRYGLEGGVTRYNGWGEDARAYTRRVLRTELELRRG